MSASETDSAVTKFGRDQFVSLLEERLRYRWLGDPEIIRDAIADLFGRKVAVRERLISDLVVNQRTGGPMRSLQLIRFLSRHQLIRNLFQNKKKISLPAGVAGNCGEAEYRWPVPPIASEGELADWLSLSSPAVLDWLTLPHRRESTTVDHYDRKSHRKRDGSLRWIEQPRPVMKRVQRTIKSELIDRIPLHEAAHGFRRRHDVSSCASLHVGKEVVLRMDLQDFFGSIRTWRIRSLFMVAGYPPPVATIMARLCTAAPLPGSDTDAVLRHSRLPQGAPSSPGLANVAAFRLDRRLAGLGRSIDACYTRYADDLIFSGGETLARRSQRFATSVAAIAMDEGFSVNFRKTVTMRRGDRQQILGLVVNQRLATPRRQYETLKAILTNCVRLGQESQNRIQHPRFRESLRGQIAHVAAVHPRRGEKLLRVFDQIDWSGNGQPTPH